MDHITTTKKKEKQNLRKRRFRFLPIRLIIIDNYNCITDN